MHHFQVRNGEMHCEGVPLRRIARDVGTPVYVYSHATLAHHYRVFDDAFGGIPHIICFSMKSNSNGSVIRTFTGLGSGVDIVSGGELARALAAGAPPGKIVYSGVGKKVPEIEEALRRGILMFNVESREELETIDAVAGRMRKRAPIAIRVNPDVDPKTHPYISTGLKKNKFGIRIEQALKDYEWAAGRRHIEVVGVDCHIGSQLTDVAPFVDAAARVRRLVDRLLRKGLPIRFVDIGGGLGIRYNDEFPPDPKAYAGAVADAFRGLPVTLVLEPGRVLVGNAGVLLTEVLYTKPIPSPAGRGKKHFFIVDAAMNDLARPSLYGSYHAILPGGESAPRKGDGGRRRPHLRIRGFPGEGPPDAAVPGGGSPRGDERGGVRLLHVLELQHPAPRRRGDGVREPVRSRPGAGDGAGVVPRRADRVVPLPPAHRKRMISSW